MTSHLQLILKHLTKFFWAIWQTTIYVLLVLLQRLLLPTACRAVTLRTEIARAILGPFLANFWDLLFKAPPGLRKSEYSQLHTAHVRAFIIPPDRDLGGLRDGENTRQKLVLLYSHGGGYVFGEPLMYMSTYKRWVEAAEREDIELTIVSVDYRLANTEKYPACLDDMLLWYDTLLNKYNLRSEQIVLGGDSAGGGLAAMSALAIKRLGIPAPGGLLLVSPWLDLEMKDTIHHPAMSTDFLISFSKDNPVLVEAFLPSDIRPSDPRVSPVYDDLSNLPPQLVISGGAEVLLPDSDKWVQKSRQAGNRVEYIVGQGQMHTYAMGWPICSSSIEKIADCQVAMFLQSLKR